MPFLLVKDSSSHTDRSRRVHVQKHKQFRPRLAGFRDSLSNLQVTTAAHRKESRGLSSLTSQFVVPDQATWSRPRARRGAATRCAWAGTRSTSWTRSRWTPPPLNTCSPSTPRCAATFICCSMLRRLTMRAPYHRHQMRTFSFSSNADCLVLCARCKPREALG